MVLICIIKIRSRFPYSDLELMSGLARLRAMRWSALTATGSHSLPTLQVHSTWNKAKNTDRPKGRSVFLELMSGLEPPTYALPRRCATNCATSANINFVLDYFIIKLFTCKDIFKKERIFLLQD